MFPAVVNNTARHNSCSEGDHWATLVSSVPLIVTLYDTPHLQLYPLHAYLNSNAHNAPLVARSVISVSSVPTCTNSPVLSLCLASAAFTSLRCLTISSSPCRATADCRRSLGCWGITSGQVEGSAGGEDRFTRTTLHTK